MADEIKTEEPKPWYQNILSWFTRPEVVNAGGAVIVAIIGLISAIATASAVKSLRKDKK